MCRVCEQKSSFFEFFQVHFEVFREYDKMGNAFGWKFNFQMEFLYSPILNSNTTRIRKSVLRFVQSSRPRVTDVNYSGNKRRNLASNPSKKFIRRFQVSFTLVRAF